MNISLLAQSPIVSSNINNSSITVNGTIYREISLGITFVVINASSGWSKSVCSALTVRLVVFDKNYTNLPPPQIPH